MEVLTRQQKDSCPHLREQKEKFQITEIYKHR